MRVLVVSTYFPPHVGGVEVVAERQARVLSRAGHDVVVATSRWDPAQPAHEVRDGYQVHRLPANNTIERRLGIPYPVIGPGHWRALRRLTRWSDVVHLHDVLYQPPQAAAVLAVLAGRPVYATQHVGPVNHPHPLVRTVERSIGAVAGRLIWRRARRVVSYNPMVTAHLRSHGVPADRIAQSSIGVDTRTFSPGPADDGLRHKLGLPDSVPLALFVGRMVDKKGHHHVVRAAAAGHHIVLAGSGRPVEPLPPGVTFLGPLPRERLIALYRLAAVFVLPSSGEVFPIAAQEAMASGLPVILTDSPRYDAYGVDRTLLRLVAPEPAVLRDAITAILADPGLRRRMGAYSRQLAETHFDAAAAESALVTLYDQPVLPRQRRGTPWTSPLSS
jgi:D-inositol-3-phosphate glycosyltransferase